MTQPTVTIPAAEYESLMSRALPQDHIDSLRAAAARVGDYDQILVERNNVQQALSDELQEKERLKILLGQIVPLLQDFSFDYPNAQEASRILGQWSTDEERAERMGEWNALRAQKISEWNSLVSHVRTQASV